MEHVLPDEEVSILNGVCDMCETDASLPQVSRIMNAQFEVVFLLIVLKSPKVSHRLAVV